MVQAAWWHREVGLTGRVRLRYRTYFFGLRGRVVAQVEYTAEKNNNPYHPWIDAGTGWRDAQVEDIGIISANMDWRDAFKMLSNQIQKLTKEKEQENASVSEPH